ncbi:glycosyl transferase family protein [Streptococcus pneumoniae]|nr:glycosyl transferase family protein [Streptococcus pneumoniae]
MTIYPNVTIFNGIHYLVDVDNELVETSQVLLDINHGEKTEEIINQFARLGKTILSFENTKTYEAGQEAYAVDQVQAMIEKLREISK